MLFTSEEPQFFKLGLLSSVQSVTCSERLRQNCNTAWNVLAESTC